VRKGKANYGQTCPYLNDLYIFEVKACIERPYPNGGCRNIKKKLEKSILGWIEKREDLRNILYQDPDGARFGQLIFPQSELQGGRPPTLTSIPEEEAKKKY